MLERCRRFAVEEPRATLWHAFSTQRALEFVSPGVQAMAHVTFTQNLARHVQVPPGVFPGRTVGEVLERVFHGNPIVRGYVLDDQGAIRHHVVVFVNGLQIEDRERLSDSVSDSDRIHVMQALSGG